VGTLPDGHTLTLENPEWAGEARVSAIDVVELGSNEEEISRRTIRFDPYPYYPTIAGLYDAIKACNNNGIRMD
jgi:hypothetical protein